MNNRATCFISYCHEDADRDSLDHLVSRFREESNGEIDFFFDADLNIGDDIERFMDLLGEVDGVILLLTPAYKERVDTRKGGVYREFSTITRRFNELESKANDRTKNIGHIYNSIRSPFCLKPIIFSADRSRSCPSEFGSKLSIDFSSYRAHRDSGGRLFETDENRRSYSGKIKKIIGEIITHNSSNSKSVGENFKKIMSCFFDETKQEMAKNKNDFEKNFSQVFVKTHAYRRVKNQLSYLLVGRKGSGKTTIAHYISTDHSNNYKTNININVNDIKLEYLFGFFSSPQVRDELDITISQLEIFEITWLLFIYISCIDIVVKESNNGRTTSEQNKYIKGLEDFIESISQTEPINYKGLFLWCYTAVFEYKEKVISTSSENLRNFSYDIGYKFSREVAVKDILTSPVFESFEKILGLCSRRFFISLDGFDTIFEEFRRKTIFYDKKYELKQKRSQFELDWLSAFIHISMDMKSSVNWCGSQLSRLVDFCVMIPKDRFLEIRRIERDGVVYLGEGYDIMWSGIELSLMLRKRMELLGGGHVSDKRMNPRERLTEIIIKEFSYIPLDTVVSMSGKDYKMSIFIDVLRHTFWRPREILIYFAKIISVLRDLKRRGVEITNFAVEKCISSTTRGIIRTEFLNEFQHHCTNLPKIVDLFRRSTQAIEVCYMKNILGSISFEFSDRTDPCLDFNSKIEFLYEIGFLGIQAGESVVKKLKLLNRDFFWFSAKDEPFEDVMSDGFNDCRFIIHPIFCEYLNLDTSDQQLTMNIDWNYLYNQESHVVISA